MPSDIYRRGLAFAVVGFAFSVATAHAEGVADVSRSPAAKVQAVGLDEVRWTTGFWADRFATLKDKSLPAMWEIMRGNQYKPYLQNFQIAAGDLDGDFHGAPFNDGDYYKFLEAVIAVWTVTHDAALEQILDQSISVIGRAQRSDGYIHTPVLIRQRHGDAAAKPFSDRADFEVYNMGHLLTAACLHYRATGKDDFLAIARKTADFLEATFREPTPQLARNSVCPSHYMGVVELYRTTREPRYLALAEKLLAMRNLVTDGGDDNQDRVPFLDQRETVGHAVRANYLFAGAADLFLETGDEKLRPPLEACWKNVVERKMYVTGGCGALYDGASPDGSKDQSQITRTHQAYGRNYQLPNATAHNETCAAVGSVLWNWRMFLVTGESKYIDVLELAAHNALLSGVSLSGTDYFYVNPLRNIDPLPAALRWSRTRTPYVTSYCCPPNVLRTIAELGGYAYAKTADSVLVNLYGGSQLTTKLGDESLSLVQTTDYPWDGRVRIVMGDCPAREFTLKLRIPAWVDASASLAVNGAPSDAAPTPGTYAQIRRAWKSGDVVDLTLPMPAVLLESHPLVEEGRNQVAVKRGPVVYCIESPDLPEGVRVSEVVVPADAKLTSHNESGLLGGVTVLETSAIVRPIGDWQGKLYRPVTRAAERTISLKLIPYYAWGNRGPSEMSVWAPLR